jgi:hypothetical protein
MAADLANTLSLVTHFLRTAEFTLSIKENPRIVEAMMNRAHITSSASKGLLSRDILLLSCL